MPEPLTDAALAEIPFDSPEALALIEAVQGEYVARYGGPDDTPVDAAEFAPPSGAFFVLRDGERAVACAGVRLLAPDLAEFKRMYVVPDARRRGHARALLAALEGRARALGAQRVQLETGTRQPEAMALYESAGYTPIAKYGHYKEAPESRCYGKDLRHNDDRGA